MGLRSRLHDCMEFHEGAASASGLAMRASLTLKYIFLALLLSLCLASDPVSLHLDVPSQVTLTNGLVNLTVTYEGLVNSISYGPFSNLLLEKPANFTGPDLGPFGGKPGDRAYYDSHGGNTLTGSGYFRFTASSGLQVILNTEDRVVVAFTSFFNGSLTKKAQIPANVKMYYSLARGVSGFHSWLDVIHSSDMPDGDIGELRFVLKLNPRIFVHSWLSDDRHRRMPDWSDILSSRSQATGILEARRILEPTTNENFQFEVDCKYHYMLTTKDQKVYGWISNTSKPIGIWVISPHKEEYASGGPLKQDLTIQTGGVLLNYFHSGHIGTSAITLKKGEAGRKTIGPWFLYLNSGSGTQEDLWDNAKATAQSEASNWPYEWASNLIGNIYPPTAQRSTLSAKFKIVDSFIDFDTVDLRNGMIGLAQTGGSGSWAQGNIGYQYWTNFSSDGSFSLTNIRAGNYYIHAFVPGVFGQFVSSSPAIIYAGVNINFGNIRFRPPRAGETLWEIGFPDRNSLEFFVPVINPKCAYPYTRSDKANKHRNYGVWQVYNQIMKEETVLYRIGSSDPSLDWWFVQPTVFQGGSYGPSTWKVVFSLLTEPPTGSHFVLRIAFAAINNAAVEVRVNSYNKTLFDSNKCPSCGFLVNDNAMARAASFGSYGAHGVRIDSGLLNLGENTILFTQRRTTSPLVSVMYDYLRLEGPIRS